MMTVIIGAILGFLGSYIAGEAMNNSDSAKRARAARIQREKDYR